jgi:uncharacterized membrane protein YgcG
VLGASAVLRESFRTSALTATILDLAVRHYLKVYETKTHVPLLPDHTSYELELTQSPSDLKPEEQSVVAILFGNGAALGARVELDSLENKLYQEAAQLGKSVNQAVTAAGYFTKDPEQVKVKFYIIGVVVAVVGCFFIKSQPLLAVGVVVSGAIIFVGAHAMPARTAKGVTARDTLLGLKLFITVAEADRIKALQSPNGRLTEKIDVGDKTQLIKLYEKLLPYAMLFGLEKAWIKQFAALYDTQPDWYSGSGAFNAAYFAGAMTSFSSTAGASFTAPSSSASGGSAGGGGGGGGGGGW